MVVRSQSKFSATEKQKGGGESADHTNRKTPDLPRNGAKRTQIPASSPFCLKQTTRESRGNTNRFEAKFAFNRHTQ
jgi:hypothetical protein